jgi:hypothetical protein
MSDKLTPAQLRELMTLATARIFSQGAPGLPDVPLVDGLVAKSADMSGKEALLTEMLKQYQQQKESYVKGKT